MELIKILAEVLHPQHLFYVIVLFLCGCFSVLIVALCKTDIVQRIVDKFLGSKT